jgi:hypothetical protein
MSLDEFKEVKEMNNNIVTQHLDRLVFIYGDNDKWCPVSFYERMRHRFAEGNITFMRDIDHAFVLDKKGTRIIGDKIVDNLIN